MAKVSMVVLINGDSIEVTGADQSTATEARIYAKQHGTKPILQGFLVRNGDQQNFIPVNLRSKNASWVKNGFTRFHKKSKGS